MDKEKAKLIFDKMKELKAIAETEPNNTCISMFIDGDYMSFFNDPKKQNCYSFFVIDGEIHKKR